MDYVKIKGWTQAFGPPADWDVETNGVCETAYVKQYQDETTGMFLHAVGLKPSAEEIEALASGAIFVFEFSVPHMPVCRAYIATDEEDKS